MNYGAYGKCRLISPIPAQKEALPIPPIPETMKAAVTHGSGEVKIETVPGV